MGTSKIDSFSMKIDEIVTRHSLIKPY